MTEALKTQLAQLYPGPSLPSPSHIRLICLRPGTDDAIYCELMVVSIDSAPSYEALSYTWGDPSITETITMTTQGFETTQQFSITSNCFSALKRLRYKDKPRVLWIDALAIDQSNVNERNHQVSLMSMIYSQAAGVIVYLGESADDSDLAIEFIMECYDPSPDNTSLSFPRSDRLMDALRNFFLRPWFTRVWVIQEVFLSSEKTVHCGEQEIPWLAMENFKHYLVNTRLQFRLPYVVSKASQSFTIENAERFMFFALLDSRHCEATDPRDKIYSLLPILQSHNRSLDLIPRYQDTSGRIYTDCALSVLPSCGWSLLYAVQGNSRTDDLPSWVPDWNVPPQRHVIGSDAIMGMGGFWEEMMLLLPALPDKPQVVMRRSVEGEKPALHGYGYSCGKISKLGSTYIAGQTPFPAQEWYNLVNRIDLSTRHGADSGYVKFPQHREFLFRFLELARYLYGSTKQEEEEDTVDDFPKPDFIIGGSRQSYREYRFGSKWEDRIRKLALEREDGVLPFRDIPFYYAAAGWPPSYGNTIRGNLEACHLRRCFVTDTGYFGLAPAEAEIGDQVFICVGSSVPFVLREIGSYRGDEFQLVGESYLQVSGWYGMVNNESQPQSLYIV
ncbi:heterokaryon incompatibility 6 OR allele [Fusarium pseudocircinatum]|uniref:Heterokaryon incompatibility 6 OR allele n=1 Tax=Fusarium pseudocircinatum TaxID=56676 RepID=A0A8H5KKU7_9HYPO|nr:heterokaryon incompatibility 6 OR allele [Fusarium pseudocircinatum]